MDQITQQIAEFASRLRFEDLPAEVVEAARVRVVDAVGCAYGGADSPTSQVTDAVLTRLSEGVGEGWQLGRPAPDLTVEEAAFANTTMIRYLDYNDWYPGGHPSDTIGGLLALAAAPDVTGQKLLTATVVSYEVFIRITRSSGFRKLGFDQGLAMGVATGAAMGNLLGLGADTIGSAVGILAASGVPTRATRSGTLSMWKGCATAYATRNAAWVVRLTRAGMTGPPEAFQGRNGIQDLVTGAFDLEPFGPDGGDYLITRTSLKFWPVCYHLQAAAWAGLELREQVGDREVERLDVGTYWEAWRDTGSERDKWDPRSRETADHSLPYVLAWTLRHGPIGKQAFEQSEFLDPALRPAMDKIGVEVDDEVQAAFPETPTMKVTAGLADGSEVAVRVARPAGHADNPMTQEQVESKFVSLAYGPLGGEDRAREVFATWWDALVGPGELPMAASAVGEAAQR